MHAERIGRIQRCARNRLPRRIALVQERGDLGLIEDTLLLLLRLLRRRLGFLLRLRFRLGFRFLDLFRLQGFRNRIDLGRIRSMPFNAVIAPLTV